MVLNFLLDSLIIEHCGLVMYVKLASNCRSMHLCFPGPYIIVRNHHVQPPLFILNACFLLNYKIFRTLTLYQRYDL